MLSLAVFLTALVLIGALATYAAAILVPLPKPNVPVTTQVYDVAGNVVSSLFVQNRVEVSLSEMPAHLKNAVIAIEDSSFYSHRGFSPKSILRALWRNISAGKVVEGGSTITQQLAKTLYLWPERTLWRKLLEVLVTIKLEATYTKDQILQMYLNQIYLGHGTYGVETASRFYFGKPVKQLTLPEAALIAALIRSPETYSPYNSVKLATDRRNLVLDRMRELKMISDSQWAAAREAPVNLAKRIPPSKTAPYLLDFVLSELGRAMPEIMPRLYTGGYKIYTAADMRVQRAADKAFNEAMPKGVPDANGVLQPQGALVALDPRTGQVKAMVGGRDFANTQLNRATSAKRQPGSAFKPFLYTALIDSGIPPTATQLCSPIVLPGATPGATWSPRDYGTQPYHYRPIGVREAIAISDNVAAVKWAQQLGPEKVASYAARMGIQSGLVQDLTIALGTSEVTPMEMATALCCLANGGYRVTPTCLTRVEDRNGTVIYRAPVPNPVPVLDARVAYVVTNLLQSVLQPGGTGAVMGATLTRLAAAKTGTTDRELDAWFVGYTPELCAVVYVGWDHHERPVGTGAAVAGPVWATFMEQALSGTPATQFPIPPGVTFATVCSETGLYPNPTCAVVTEPFLEETLPDAPCPLDHWATTPIFPPEFEEGYSAP
ncbi:MAG: transglycosylase domain-containing protein [Bacillota bacterium]